MDRDMNSVIGLVSVAMNPRHDKSSTPGCRTNCKDTGKARSIDQTQGTVREAGLKFSADLATQCWQMT